MDIAATFLFFNQGSCSWWPQSQCSSLLPGLRQLWSKPSESTQEDWCRDVVALAVCSWGGRSLSLTPQLSLQVTLSSVGGIAGGVLHVLNQNRLYCGTPPKWLHSSAMSPLDRQSTNNLTSPLVDLWGGAAKRNAPWMWLELGVLG